MKLIKDKTNVVAPDATYPFGNMKDKVGAIPGTPADTEFMVDFLQFFEKMFSESGLVANGLPDNDVNGFQLWNALRVLVPLKTKIIEIGDWDMDADGTNTVAHGLTMDKIRKVSVVIINDVNTSRVFLSKTSDGGVSIIDATDILLTRAAAGGFDSTSYDSTSYNRGFVTIQYVD